MKRIKFTAALAAVLWATTTFAGTYGWNIGSGAWDAASANWSGAGTVWVDNSGNDAMFTNNLPAAATLISIDGTRTAGIVKVGNASNNARYIFTNGTLNVTALHVRGLGSNGTGAGSATPTVLSNLTLNTTDHIIVDHWTLQIGGSSVVNVAKMIYASDDWGYLTIKDNATVTVANGVSSDIRNAFVINLDGGTLITKSVQGSDREGGGTARLTFNGTVLKPTQDTDTFVTVRRADYLSTYSALVGNGGAVIDTDGKNIGIDINLKPASSSTGGLTKLGSGTLTLSGTNTYSGATLVSNGTLRASSLALPSSTYITVEAEALLDLSGASHTVNGLSGKGVVTDGTLTVTRLLQPGGTNMIGTLTVPGGTVLTGKLLVDVAADGTCDLLAVQGGINLTAANLAVSATSTLNSNTNYTLLTYTGTPARFASVSTPAGWSVVYRDGTVLLAPNSAITYSWGNGSGTWDLTSANWSGAGTMWADDSINVAIFTNNLPANATLVAIDGTRTAGAVKVGNSSNNIRYIFTDGTLNADSLTVLGLGSNGANANNTTPTVLSNMTLNTIGHIGVGKWTLTIGGSSIINVGGMIGGQITGIGNADWGYVTIQDNAVVTANGGVSGETTEAWILNLNGGTLVTKSIWASDREAGGTARLTFNGTTVKPTQDTNNFATVGPNHANTYSALVGNGGAIFDTDGKNIGVKINLKPVSGSTGGLTKLGNGTLTLSGTNSYSGATLVAGGTLAVVDGSLPNDTAVQITEGSAAYVQDLSSQTIGSLAGVAGASVVNSGALTVGGNGATTTFAGVVSGAGSLVKAGSGTLTLNGANTYTGATAVVAGTLEITASNTLSTNTTLEVATGALVKLSNAEEQQVAALTFDGMPRYRGTWGSPESTATLKSTRFTGGGILRVLTGDTSPGTMVRIR